MYLLLAAEMNPYVAVILDHLLEVVASLILVAGIPLVHKLASIFHVKTGIEITAKTQAAIDTAIHKGVGLAEEWAHQKLKAKETVDGAAKMDKAISLVEAEIKEMGLDAMGKERLQKLIEAKLGLER